MVNEVPPSVQAYVKSQINDYIKIRGWGPLPSRQYSGYNKYWFAELTLKFHATIAVLRDLLFDPHRNLEWDINDISRHHGFPGEKLIMDANRIAFTSKFWHNELEGIDGNILMALIKERWTSPTCPQYYINEWGQIDGQDRWNKFKAKRDEMINDGIGKFLENNAKDFLDLYYYGIPISQIETEIRNVIQEWIYSGQEIPWLPKFMTDKLINPLLSINRYLGNI